jgi:Flp pilus assembly protein TadD
VKASEGLEGARMAPDPAPIYVTLALGTALVHAGDFEAAERELRAAVSADPSSGDAHNNLAVALLMTGSLDEAEREAREAERLGVPVNPRLYEEIHRRRK